LASFWQEFARRFKEPPRGEGVIFNKRLIFGEPGSGRCVYAVKSGQPPTPRPPNARTFSSPRFPPGAGASFVRRRQKNSRAERGSYGASIAGAEHDRVVTGMRTADLHAVVCCLRLCRPLDCACGG
jgi:hypothetical protein